MEDEHYSDDFTEDKMHFMETTSNSWKEWLNIIEKELEAESESETDQPNAYQNIQFVKIFKKDILLLPLWTKILKTKIGYGSTGGSTASCEGEINKIKNIVFKDIKNKTIRVDTFVQRHIEHLFGEMLLVDVNSKTEQYKFDKTTLNESQDLQEKENWKGKIIRKCKVPKLDSTGSCSTFSYNNKENIIEETFETHTMTTDKENIKEKIFETHTMTTKFLKNEEDDNNILKDITNKSCTKKQ